MDKVEFVKFGTKPRDNRTYAVDGKGVMWVCTENEIWESIESEPRRIKRGLTTGELMLFMSQRQVQIV